jgi:hypothetical protein
MAGYRGEWESATFWLHESGHFRSFTKLCSEDFVCNPLRSPVLDTKPNTSQRIRLLEAQTCLLLYLPKSTNF